ncbi:hypothetical protein [Actinomadura rugatobispora]|uniref:Tetratricopeptide repeat protein n=1 Tax=Actinomadura rugatobispora TaxID=1994 RepID=A0ABW0ZS70_9ACTN|nr:hypothetical protein GCM10010200_023190 [Actinomadura rugatobispora]
MPDDLVIPAGGDVPFAAAREFIRRILTEDEVAAVARPLRPVLHTTPDGTWPGDRQRLKSQLRFPTRLRGRREFRAVAWLLNDRRSGPVEVVTAGPLSPADADFFGVLSRYGPVVLRTEGTRGAGTSEEHPGDAEVAADMARVRAGLRGEADWSWLCRRLGRYLSCGDSWTGLWLAQAVLDGAVAPSGAAANMMASAFFLQNRTSEAELLFRAAMREGGVQHARGAYGLAMLYTRHHPRAWRDVGAAADLLESGWRALSPLPDSDEIVRERVLNRNGLALVLHKEGDGEGAIALLRDSVRRLVAGGLEASEHHSVLLNNLGRVCAASGGREAEAESALRQAAETDPRFAEYWLDLALFLAERGRHDEALAAARAADGCSAAIAEIPALLGYLHAVAGDHARAAAHYQEAAAKDPGAPEHALAASRELIEVGEHRAARGWLARLDERALTGEQRAEAALLALEIDANGSPPLSTVQVAARLRELADVHPGSDLVSRNLRAVTGGP